MRLFRMKMGDNIPTNRLGGGMITSDMIVSLDASKVTGGSSGGGGTTTNSLTIHAKGGDVVFNGSEAKEVTIPQNVSELTNDSDFQTASEVTSALEPYAKTEALSNYATTSSLGSYVQTSVADSTYVKVSELNEKVNALISSALANYYTKSEADGKFQPKAQ